MSPYTIHHYTSNYKDEILYDRYMYVVDWLVSRFSSHPFTEDWLVEFDGDISISMAGLRPLVDQHLARIAVNAG